MGQGPLGMWPWGNKSIFVLHSHTHVVYDGQIYDLHMWFSLAEKEIKKGREWDTSLNKEVDLN